MRLLPASLLPAVLLAAASLVTAPPPANAQDAGGAAAPGGVPTLSQQPSGEIPQDAGPARAPGSNADAGSTLAPATANSGTTTVFAAPSARKEAPWPCAQRKVSTISGGTIWSGPDLAQGKDWDQDNDVASLAQRLASRRLTLDEVDPLVADFARQAGSSKDKRLTQLFVGVLDIVNGNRDQILQGIQRYAQGQERLAERMRDESDKISASQDEATASDLGVAATQQNRDFAWDQRIFKERRQALSYVCETPSLLERRVFEVGKRIQAQL